ncbi:dienelactone hydrolase family protein [Euzebya pacifica]|uniref:dienelactone hydrolase family protein n=1 Tax=Euzebya pacifica TaxID=1608957 RepID=UPI0030FB2297
MATDDWDDLSDFTVDTFTHDGSTKTVYRAGEGPGVLFMHEVPGITPTNAAFARRLVDAGFTVAMPDLLGDAGRPLDPLYAGASMAKLCISREFRAFALQADRPIVRWLRALGRDLHTRAGGPGIGAVGMCMTGGFALGLAVDDHVLAPVLSQPSLPVAVTPLHARDLGIPDDHADIVADRCRDEGLCILGLRFEKDLLAPAARFRALAKRFGDAFEAVELDVGEWKRTRASLPEDERPMALTPTPHAVLGGDYLDGPPTKDALQRVLDLFTDRLTP